MTKLKKIREEWHEYKILEKVKYIFDIGNIFLGICIAAIACYYASLQTNIYNKQEEVARRQTQPIIVLDISANYDNFDGYHIKFSSEQGIVYNLKFESYACVLATVYDFSSIEFENEQEEKEFYPYNYMFYGEEYSDRTIVLPIRTRDYFFKENDENTKEKKNFLIEGIINSSCLDEIEESANYDICVDKKNKHWVCFSRGGVFFKLSYQDVYGINHSDYYLLNPSFLYDGIYKLNDKMGEDIYNDCFEVMGNITSHDCITLNNLDLDVLSITDEIAEKEIKDRYKKSLKLSKENIIPVFYTYIND